MISVWVALCMTLLIAMTGLMIDSAYVVLSENQLQNAADAGALAGAQLVSTDPNGARLSAISTALANYVAGTNVVLNNNPGNGSGGEVVAGTYSRSTGVFTPTLSSPNAFKVVANRTAASHGPLDLLFGPIFGRNTIDLSRTATAIVQSSSGNAGLLVLDPHASGALTVKGNGSVDIIGAGVQVNSDNGSALQMNGNATIVLNTDNVGIVGNYSFTGNASVNGGPITTGDTTLPDPLAGLPAPTVTNNLGTVSLSGNSSATLNPGYYPGGISTKGNASVTLNPGIYNLGGAGLQISGNGSFTANGVMIYVSGTGSVSLTGNGAVSITPPNPAVNTYTGASTYQGIAIFQDRADAQADTITGNGNMNITGTLYFPDASLSMKGNGDTLGSQVIADEASLTGNGSIKINYTGGITPPTSTAVFLVK